MKKSVVIGYTKTCETAPGAWTEKTEEIRSKAEVVSNKTSYASSNQTTNDTISCDYKVTCIKNRRITEYITYIRYITINGVKWKVTSFSEEPPEITFNVGGIYNA